MNSPDAKPRIALGVIILAAGRSVRMGAPKMLLPWGRGSVLGHLIQQWQGLQAGQIAVVCAADDQPIQAELTRLGFPGANRILNPAPEDGMFSSIQSAARWTGWQPGLTHWTIVLGDQPHLGRQTLRTLMDCCAIHPASVCQPRYRGHRHHPVFLPKSVFIEAATTHAANLKDFLETVPAKPFHCELNDPALELDIDRPEDYQEALARFGRRT